MTTYRMTRTVTVEGPELLNWWLEAVGGDPNDYDAEAALELLLSDEHLTDLDVMGFVTLGEPDVWRENGDG